jgi:hypothetical protein
MCEIKFLMEKSWKMGNALFGDHSAFRCPALTGQTPVQAHSGKDEDGTYTEGEGGEHQRSDGRHVLE